MTVQKKAWITDLLWKVIPIIFYGVIAYGAYTAGAAVQSVEIADLKHKTQMIEPLNVQVQVLTNEIKNLKESNDNSHAAIQDKLDLILNHKVASK